MDVDIGGIIDHHHVLSFPLKQYIPFKNYYL
jgi:inorganic pyrophosphatase/exopolyphosphatase